MSIKVTYADWLANYSPRQYKENTIRTYVSALEKAPGRLGITLEKPIIEHLSTKEFDALYQYLTGLKNYTAVNKGYLCVQNGVGRAYVEGTKWYRVDFHFNDGMMTDIYCDCPYSELCKHEVAVTLTLRMLFKQPQFKNAGDFMALDRWAFWQLASRAESITI